MPVTAKIAAAMRDSIVGEMITSARPPIIATGNAPAWNQPRSFGLT